MEKIENDSLKEIVVMKNDFEANKDKVCDFLFKHVISVSITVPRVVIGNFEENYDKEKKENN